MPRNKYKMPLSIGKSIVVWVAGAVFGWVVAVVFIYGTLRFTSEERVADKVSEEAETSTAQDVQQDAQEIQKIAPAAGTSQSETLGGGGNAQPTEEERGENDAPAAPPQE